MLGQLCDYRPALRAVHDLCRIVHVHRSVHQSPGDQPQPRLLRRRAPPPHQPMKPLRRRHRLTARRHLKLPIRVIRREDFQTRRSAKRQIDRSRHRPRRQKRRIRAVKRAHARVRQSQPRFSRARAPFARPSSRFASSRGTIAFKIRARVYASRVARAARSRNRRSRAPERDGRASVRALHGRHGDRARAGRARVRSRFDLVRGRGAGWTKRSRVLSTHGVTSR